MSFFLVIYSFLCVFKTPRGYCFPGEQKQRSDTKYETGNRCKRVYYMTWGDSTCLLVYKGNMSLGRLLLGRKWNFQAEAATS